MRVELTDGVGFSSAHFVVYHKKCEYLHGHNYRVGLAVEGDQDEQGLVVDFFELKKMLGKICDSYDHRLLLPAKNSAIERRLKGNSTRISVHGSEFEFPNKDLVWLPVVNITAEELARVIADEIVKNLSAYPNVKKISVFVEESPGKSAGEERLVRP
jgi:6-pyruvoyltetrahydropterin/6-carboxytetrahydropterin synthase